MDSFDAVEPCRDYVPKKKYLEELRKISNKNNCVLIFDEITCAWRIGTSGTHKNFGVNPDIAVFGKTIANGIPMGAIIGKKRIMKFSTKTFISSVFWTEKIGPAHSRSRGGLLRFGCQVPQTPST